jgi:hypothetical protein
MNIFAASSSSLQKSTLDDLWRSRCPRQAAERDSSSSLGSRELFDDNGLRATSHMLTGHSQKKKND